MKLNPTTAFRWMLVTACMALVVLIRLDPLRLAGSDELAERLAQEQVQAFVALEISQKIPAAQRAALGEFDTAQWIEQNPDAYARLLAEESRKLKDQWSYRVKDGGEYAYLGDLDSYLWLRQARNKLRTGTECDAELNGSCRDTFTLAPVGAHMAYQGALHTAAIVAVHSAITLFATEYPLPASAFLVPVIIGALGVLPAFFIGWRLAGIVGGVFAALLVSLQPELLLRSMGGDNDIWNVVLPLFAIWAAMAALGARNTMRQAALAAIAGAVIGLQALNWSGWPFTYAILLGSLLACLLLQGLRQVTAMRQPRIWRAPAVRKIALVAATFYVSAGAFTALAGSEQHYFSIPVRAISEVTGWTAGAAPAGAPETAPLPSVAGPAGDLPESEYWPDVLTTVSELLQPDTGAIITAMGGKVYFLAALFGLLLLLLPPKDWDWRHLVVLFAAISAYGFLISGGDLHRGTALWLVAAPLAGALIVYLLPGHDTGDTEIVGGLILVVWFIAALHLSYAGHRFLLLMGPPLGIACAVAVGRLAKWSRVSASGAFSRSPVISNFALTAVLLALLLHPVQRGYARASTFLPQMNDAWWDTLTRIRNESAPDAIVNAWWDHGHWIKYAAERRVLSDGSSQRTHVPHWFAKALMAPGMEETTGLLRMLNCGSDATPRPEGDRGGYGRLRALGYDPVSAYATVEYLARVDRGTARAFLKSQGVSDPMQRRGVLDATHCEPPEAYLVLSSRLFELPALTHLGRWDPRRAYVASQARNQDMSSAADNLIERFGYSQRQAAWLLRRAQARASKQAATGVGSFESQLNSFIGSSRGLLTPEWLPCEYQGEPPALICPLDMGVELEGILPGAILEQLIYEPGLPGRTRFVLGHSERDSTAEVAPGALILAGRERKQEVEVASPRLANVGVLLDLANQRVLLGPPHLVRSTIADLMYLDGRYTEHFEKFDEQLGPTGDRVVTWKIDWAGSDGS